MEILWWYTKYIGFASKKFGHQIRIRYNTNIADNVLQCENGCVRTKHESSEEIPKKNRTNDTNNIDIDSQQQMVQIRNH